MTEADLRIQPAYRIARLSVERVAYGALTAAALGLRLLDLGARPLGPAEAAQALPAWQAAHSAAYTLADPGVWGAASALTPVSALLFGLQRWVFTAVGGDDGWARLWPALLGGLAVALFYGLRNRLGRGGALAAAFLWAFSPLAVFTGRLGLGEALIPPLALALLVCLNAALGDVEYKSSAFVAPSDVESKSSASAALGDVESKSSAFVAPGSQQTRRLLIWAGALVGALLAAGTDAYTVLLLALLAALIWREPAARWRRAGQGSWRAAGIAAVVSLALWASAFFTAPAGLAAAADLLGGWLRGLIPSAGPYTPWDVLRTVLIGEPLLVGFGVAGLVMAARRRDAFGLFAGLALLAALWTAVVGGGRDPVHLGLAALALTLTAGPAVAWTLAAVWHWRDELDFWLLVSLALALMVTLSISLAGAVGATDPQHRSLFTAVFGGVMLLSVGLWVIYGFWGSWRVVGRSLPVVAFVVALVWSLGQLNGLNYDADPLRRSAVLAAAPGPGWGDFRAALRDLSALHGGGGQEAHVDLLLPQTEKTPLAPVLRWALRNDPALRVVTTLPANPAPLVAAPAGLQAALGDRYSGQSFTLLETWQPASLGAWTDQARWLLYRQAKSAASQTWDVVLWADRKTSGAVGEANGAGAPTAPAVPSDGVQSQ